MILFILRRKALLNQDDFLDRLPALLRNKVIRHSFEVEVHFLIPLQGWSSSFMGIILNSMDFKIFTHDSIVYFPTEGPNAVHFALKGRLVKYIEVGEEKDSDSHKVLGKIVPGDVFGIEEMLDENAFIGVRSVSVSYTSFLSFRTLEKYSIEYPQLFEKLIDSLTTVALAMQQKQDKQNKSSTQRSESTSLSRQIVKNSLTQALEKKNDEISVERTVHEYAAMKQSNLVKDGHEENRPRPNNLRRHKSFKQLDLSTRFEQDLQNTNLVQRIQNEPEVTSRESIVDYTVQTFEDDLLSPRSTPTSQVQRRNESETWIISEGNR